MRKFYQVTSKSFDAEGVKTFAELWTKVKGEFDALSIRSVTVFEKTAESDKFHATFSTASEDRHGDIVYQSFDLKNFKSNPVFLDTHNYSSIEHIIGRVDNIKVKDNKLQGDVVFALDNPKGLLAYKLAAGGFLNTTSIGFIPKEFDDKGNITKSEMLEISGVSVPANAEALFDKKSIESKDLHFIRKTAKDRGVMCIYCREDITDEAKQFLLETSMDDVFEVVCESCYAEKHKDNEPEPEAPAEEPVEEKPAEEADAFGRDDEVGLTEALKPEPIKAVDRKKIALGAINQLNDEHIKSLQKVAGIIDSMTENHKSKRKALQIVRGLIKQDISV